MKRIDTINMIPMIDIMLVMLAIVLTTATFIKFDQTQIDLPVVKSSSGPPGRQGNRINIDRQGNLFLNNRQITLEELDLELSGMDGETPIALRVDQATSFGSFANIIDLLKSRQMNRLSIIAKPSE